MASLKQIKKNVTKNSLLFPLEMYTSLPGSIVITSCILNNRYPDMKELKKKWKYYTKHSLGFDLTDKDYIKKVCDIFGVEEVKGNAAFVQSDYNALICPYYKGNIYPLREDGLFTLTLRKGKIYPITEEGITNECTE